MDKEQYLELYKNKFEYLEFNDYILKAFDKAYEVAKKNKAENFNMTLEYRFILELIFIIKNGYKDAYDALSIYCEKYNEFYLRKKKNLVKDISQMTQKEYYDKAFEITINNYMEGQIFYKELMQNLILVYKNQIPSKGVLDMKYDSSIKSIYDLFAKYNREVVEMVLEVSKTVEPNSTSILMKKYGQKFDGVNPQRITYIENSRIDNILTRIEQKIELTEYEINNGKTLKSMSKFLKKCGDVLLLEAISNMKKNKSETTILTNISDIKKKYDINDTILKMAIDFNKETIEKKVFYYTFGFTTAKKSIREICNLLEINSYSYNNYLNSILSKLPELIRQAQEYYELMQENPVKKEEQKEKIAVNKVKIPMTKKLKKTFFEYFYDEKNTQEEIEQIKKNIKFLLSKKANIQGYDLLIRRYGQDYCTLDENVVFNKQENSMFNSFRQNLKKELYKKNGDKTTIDSKTHTITSFFDYFYTDTMSLEEKEQIKKFIIEYLETRKKSIAYAVLIKKFGENYDTLNDNISLNKQENNNLGALRQSIKKALVAKKDQTDNSRKKISVKKKTEQKHFMNTFMIKIWMKNKKLMLEF